MIKEQIAAPLPPGSKHDYLMLKKRDQCEYDVEIDINLDRDARLENVLENYLPSCSVVQWSAFHHG